MGHPSQMKCSKSQMEAPSPKEAASQTVGERMISLTHNMHMLIITLGPQYNALVM